MDTNLYPNFPTVFGVGHRVSRATSTLPQSDTLHLFQVTGGRIAVMLFFGEVTTIIQNSDPVAKITSTPTTGSAVDIASTVDLSSLEVGGIITAEGDTSALIKTNAGAGIITNTAIWICPIGYIDLICGASKSGAVKWQIHYFPLDEGAAVAAV